MEDFQVAIEEQGSLKRKLTITVPQAKVKTAYDKVYNSLKTKVKVPGFRPGKVPQSLMEKRFEKYMAEEAMETLVPEYYQKAMEQEKLTPAIHPEYADLQVDKKKPLVFSATVEIWPEIKLPDFKGLKLDEQAASFTEDELKAQRNNHLERFATYEPKKGASAEGDRVLISFEAKTEDDQDVSQPNHFYVVGSNQFIPEFEEALAGMKEGDEKEFDATLPADHPREEFRSKKTHFTVKMHGVDDRKLPAVDAEFLKNYEGRAATPEEFETFIENELKKIKQQHINTEYRTSLREQLGKSLDFEVPGTLIEQEAENQRQDLEHKGETGDLEQLSKDKALESLRLARFVYLVQDQEKIEIDSNDVYHRFITNAQMLGLDANQLMQSEHGRQFYQDTQHMVTEERVLDFISDKVLKP